MEVLYLELYFFEFVVLILVFLSFERLDFLA
jgi:hypothetical protein